VRPACQQRASALILVGGDDCLDGEVALVDVQAHLKVGGDCPEAPLAVADAVDGALGRGQVAVEELVDDGVRRLHEEQSTVLVDHCDTVHFDFALAASEI